MLKRIMVGGSTLLLAVLAMSSTRADACNYGCGCGGCGYPAFRLPLYFSSPYQTSFVYYPGYHGRRWSHSRRVYYYRRHLGHRHW
jgi:hypothetical protein